MDTKDSILNKIPEDMNGVSWLAGYAQATYDLGMSDEAFRKQTAARILSSIISHRGDYGHCQYDDMCRIVGDQVRRAIKYTDELIKQLNDGK